MPCLNLRNGSLWPLKKHIMLYIRVWRNRAVLAAAAASLFSVDWQWEGCVPIVICEQTTQNMKQTEAGRAS